MAHGHHCVPHCPPTQGENSWVLLAPAGHIAALYPPPDPTEDWWFPLVGLDVLTDLEAEFLPYLQHRLKNGSVVLAVQPPHYIPQVVRCMCVGGVSGMRVCVGGGEGGGRYRLVSVHRISGGGGYGRVSVHRVSGGGYMGV